MERLGTRRVRLVALRVRALLATVLARALMGLTRPRRQALVAGLPDWEENALVTAAVLAERYQGRVVLVAQDPVAARVLLDRVARVMGADDAAGRVEVVAKSARGTFWQFVRSELVFYTHGLYDSPRPVRRRIHVNLWHGTGPKWNANANTSQRIGADVLAAAGRVWGAEVARALSMPRGTTIVTGNARQDVMLASTPRDVLAELGLDPTAPVVLWMPTFRSSARAGRVGLREGVPLTSESRSLAGRIVHSARESGVQLVLKAHRHDDDDYARLGVRVVTTAQVLDAGLTLYQLVGLADGLLSDYSSVWVDYLPTGRSVGLYCPDLADYERDRGLNSPGLREVAGELLLDGAAAEEFFDDVAGGRVFRGEALEAARQRLGVDPGRSSRTQAMLSEVAQIGRERYGRDFGLPTTWS